MKAITALYQNGKVFFPFTHPECEGPVSVLVIFPDPQEEDPLEEWESEDLPYPV